jgi:phosphohistidine phosphatase
MIFLIRHAHAVSDEEDPLRPLSSKGRDQVARVCDLLRSQAAFAPVEIWHSPLSRARETAALLARGLGLQARIVLRKGLEPDDDPAEVARALNSERRSIAVVGHEPHLGILASLMARGPALAHAHYHFSKAGVLALSRKDKGWRTEWLVRSP